MLQRSMVKFFFLVAVISVEKEKQDIKKEGTITLPKNIQNKAVQYAWSKTHILATAF